MIRVYFTYPSGERDFLDFETEEEAVQQEDTFEEENIPNSRDWTDLLPLPERGPEPDFSTRLEAQYGD